MEEELEERRRAREDEYGWKLEQDMLEYDNRSYRDMIDDYKAFENLDQTLIYETDIPKTYENYK